MVEFILSSRAMRRASAILIAITVFTTGLSDGIAVTQAAETNEKSTVDKSADAKQISAAAIEPFLGRFESDKVKLVCRGEGEKIRGEIVLGDQVVDFVGELADGKMTGLFSVGGVVSQFTATLQGEVMTFTSGLQVIKLKKIKSALVAKNLTLREKELATNDACVESTIIVTPNNSRFAFVEARDGHRRVVVDGVAGKPYFNIGFLAFSPDGSRISYVGVSKNEWQVMIDDQESQKFDAIDDKLVSFSDDGKRYAYVARMGSQWHMVVDGKISMPFEACGGISFSPGGKRLAFAIRVNNQWDPIVDGKKGPAADAVGKVLFNSDGSRHAYAKVRGAEQFVVIDGVASQGYEAVKSTLFSDDGKRLGFVGVRSFKEYAVIDGQTSKAYDSIDFLSFSPDSKRVAYRARREGKYQIVIDGKAIASHDEVGQPVFSPDSQSVSYWVKEKGKRHVMADGKKGQPYDQAVQLKYGPVGRRLGYVARLDRKFAVVVDGKQSQLFDSIGKPGVVFSSDGGHYAFVGTRNGKQHIVVDHTEAEIPGKLLPGSEVVFTGPNTLRTLIRRNDKFIRLDVDVVE